MLLCNESYSWLCLLLLRLGELLLSGLFGKEAIVSIDVYIDRTSHVIQVLEIQPIENQECKLRVPGRGGGGGTGYIP